MKDTVNVADQKLRPHAKLGFTALEATEMTERLNRIIANCQVHAQKLRNYHWNVVGPDFFELHGQFGELYKKMDNYIDDLAERVRVFGIRPYSTLKMALELSQVKESVEDMTAFDMVKDVNKDMDIILSFYIEAINTANENGDAGTVQLLNRMILELETDIWKLRSWIKESSYEPFSKN